MTTPAQKIQQKIKEYVREKGYDYVKIMSASRRGQPDIQIVICSDTFYFEVKSENDTLKKAQELVHSELNKNKTVCFVVNSFEDFLEQFQEVEKMYAEQLKINLTNSFKNGRFSTYSNSADVFLSKLK